MARLVVLTALCFSAATGIPYISDSWLLCKKCLQHRCDIDNSKILEKLKSESKLYYQNTRRCTTGTGGGPSDIKIDPILEQVCALLGRACTGIVGVQDCDSDFISVAVEEDATLGKKPCLDKDAADETILNCFVEAAQDHAPLDSVPDHKDIEENQTRSDETETMTKTPLWSRRRPQYSQTNERTAAISSICSSFTNVNRKKEDIEDLKKQLLSDEINFKAKLYELQLEAARKEVEIKTEILKQIKAFPKEVVFGNLGSELRYQHIQAKNTRLIDSLISLKDLSIYVPSRDNEFHLFTRDNPTTSQPLLLGNNLLLQESNFSPTRRTVVLLHGYQGSSYSDSNLVLIPAYLAAADVNVVVVDWSRGANSRPIISSLYAALSSINVGRFIYWLSESSGQQLSEFTLVGIGLSALKAGVIGRLLRTEGVTIGHIVALDPAFGPRTHELFPMLRPTDADYIEVVHTNVGNLGFIKPMGQVDFYPNSGLNMPGCGRNDECDRNRAFFYWAESLTSGGFTGIQCEDYEEALNQECEGPNTLQMGGVNPKPGASGVYSVRTNAAPPFSLD